MLTVDGTPQSHVDLDDPTYLSFEYVRRLGHVVDLVAPPGDPLRVVHLGAGALTLARYVGATRPGSRQRAVEVSGEVAAAVRDALPLARDVRVPVQVADAREALTRLRDGSADLVVLDVFAGARTPAHLTSVEMVAQVRRVLAPGGLVAANVADRPGLAFARGQVATYSSVHPHVAAVAEPAVWRGRRFGNVVLLASGVPLPTADLTRRCAGDPVPARVVAGDHLARWVGGAAVVTDATAVPSPAPPTELFGRGRGPVAVGRPGSGRRRSRNLGGVTSPTVVVLDHGSGNLRSAERALARAGADVTVTADARLAADADGLVVPGVGAFATCMAGLRAVHGPELIGRRLAGGRPVLGICVGMQVLFDSGDEHGVVTKGCGEWPGTVERLHAGILPHMGWNTVRAPAGSRLFAGLEGQRFYFVHSYGVRRWELAPSDRMAAPLVTWAEHGEPFVAAVENGPLSATQFHPEKSGDAGAELLRTWVRSL